MSAVATVAVAPTQTKQLPTANGLPNGWLNDPLEALKREHGPFTAVTAEQLLDTESVDIFAPQPSAEAIASEVAQGWIQQGANQRSIEMARTMLADGLEPATVAKYSGLSVAQVTALQAA